MLSFLSTIINLIDMPLCSSGTSFFSSVVNSRETQSRIFVSLLVLVPARHIENQLFSLYALVSSKHVCCILIRGSSSFWKIDMFTPRASQQFRWSRPKSKSHIDSLLDAKNAPLVNSVTLALMICLSSPKKNTCMSGSISFIFVSGFAFGRYAIIDLSSPASGAL